jgi:hypothetical protein
LKRDYTQNLMFSGFVFIKNYQALIAIQKRDEIPCPGVVAAFLAEAGNSQESCAKFVAVKPPY